MQTTTNYQELLKRVVMSFKHDPLLSNKYKHNKEVDLEIDEEKKTVTVSTIHTIFKDTWSEHVGIEDTCRRLLLKITNTGLGALGGEWEDGHLAIFDRWSASNDEETLAYSVIANWAKEYEISKKEVIRDGYKITIEKVI